jgi:hypothetical protein
VGGPQSLSETVKKKNSCPCQNESWLQDLPILEKHCFDMIIRIITNKLITSPSVGLSKQLYTGNITHLLDDKLHKSLHCVIQNQALQSFK